VNVNIVKCNIILCYLLGNVAHDLRTPLQAFQSELELLRVNINDQTSTDKTNILDSMNQLDRICNFMNMTINRSIDFAKASCGIKLNPSIESINFFDALNWAVSCVATQDEKVPILRLPIPPTICNQIYTDKQWMMENMLCLLSNAKKFTTEGEITIRCSLRSLISRNTVVQKPKLFLDDAQDDDVEMGFSSFKTNLDTVIPMMLMIEVEDTGFGVSSENNDFLFKPFVQVFCCCIDSFVETCQSHYHFICYFALTNIILLGSAQNWRHWARTVFSC
jgi:signal transduction histidine kinase